jgi:cholesterol transport system auxiliary component
MNVVQRKLRSSIATWCTALGAALSLAACSGLLLPKPAAEPARHTLDGGPAEVSRATAVREVDSRVIQVAMPRAAPGYDSRRMVYQRHPLELQAFAFHEWVEPPAALLAPLLVRALQDGGGFRAALLAPSVAAPGWILESELVWLQQDFQRTPSQVRLRLRAVLLDGATRQVLAWREIDAQVAARSDDPVAGVRAAQQAAQQVAAAVVEFCVAERQRARP